MVEGDRFELPNRKELIYSQPRLTTSLSLHIWRFLLESNQRLLGCSQSPYHLAKESVSSSPHFLAALVGLEPTLFLFRRQVVSPLTDKAMAREEWVEHSLTGSKPVALPLGYSLMVGLAGLEPATSIL
jgi:hypothetical protein